MRKIIMLVVLVVLLLGPTVHSKNPQKSMDCYKVTVACVLDEFTFVSDDYQIEARNSGLARAEALKYFREDHPEYKGYERGVYEVTECTD